MTQRTFFLLFFLFMVSIPSASGRIPHVSPEMEEVDYWVQRLPEPDKVLKSPEAIKTLNQKFLHTESTAVDPLTLGEKVKALFFLGPIEKEETTLLQKTLYDRTGKRLGREFLETLKGSAGLIRIPEWIPVRFGVVVEECSLRTFPTMEPVVEEKGKLAFDLFQQSTLHPGTPIAILWVSPDREWAYLVSRLLRGWVQEDNIVIFDRKEELADYLKGEKVIVTEPRAPFYAEPGGEKMGEWLMGTVLHTPSIQEEGDFYRIERPVRDEAGRFSYSHAFVRKEEVSLNFLPLTRRHIVTQACKLQGFPYGWGGFKGGWDCSSFLRDVFLTMGVELPRNSGPQSKIGKILATFPKGEGGKRKKEVLNQSLPVATFVKLDNHIMLYLGKVGERYYVIHSTAGYWERKRWYKGFRQRAVAASRVLVSDMDLGEGGPKGSLLERVVSINAPFVDEKR